MLLRSVWLCASSLGLKILNHVDDLNEYRLKNPAGDYLLLHSGKDCLRCEDFEVAMTRINQHSEIPVVIAKYENNSDPILEYHQWNVNDPHDVGGGVGGGEGAGDGAVESATGGYSAIPYNGHLTLSHILSFLQKISKHGPQQCESLEKCIAATSRGLAPFVGIFPNEDSIGLVVYNKAVREIVRQKVDGAKFWYVIDRGSKHEQGQLTVNHPSEMRLATGLPSVDFVVEWIKNERIPMFGKLTKSLMLAMTVRHPDAGWVLYLADDSSFNLYEHEFRVFSMFHRDEWNTGFVSIDERKAHPTTDWSLIRKVLNTEQPVEEIKEMVKTQCKNECLVVRKKKVVQFIRRSVWSSDILTHEIQEIVKSAETLGQRFVDEDMGTAPVPDLKILNEGLKNVKINVVTRSTFSEKVRDEASALLLLLHDVDQPLSQELMKVYLDVVDTLSNKGLKFFEMTDLPPPDDRYSPPRLPYLWFKPSGAGETPLEIPWQTDEDITTVMAFRDQTARQALKKWAEHALSLLVEVKNAIVRFIWKPLVSQFQRHFRWVSELASHDL